MTEARWFKQHRLEWIAETLRVYGYINRAHVERKFGISVAQASIDLRDFQVANPGAVIYDKIAKFYRLTSFEVTSIVTSVGRVDLRRQLIEEINRPRPDGDVILELFDQLARTKVKA